MTARLTTIKNIPAELKQALIDDAAATNRSVADTATAILSAWFDIAYESTGKTTGPNAGISDQLQLRLSTELAASLWSLRRAWACSQSQAANKIFAERYGVDYEIPVRGHA